MNPISRLLQRTALSVKLPIFIAVPPVLILLFAVSMLSIQVHKVLDDEHRTSYQTLLDERSAVLERWLDDAAADISAFSISGNAILGVRDFANSWRPLKGVPPEEYLRQLYITDNPNPKGERDKLITAHIKKRAGITTYFFSITVVILSTLFTRRMISRPILSKAHTLKPVWGKPTTRRWNFRQAKSM
jgi:hypothetical protein